MSVAFNVTEFENFSLVEMTIEGDGVLEFSELPQIIEQLPTVDPAKGVVLSGRLPIPAYMAIGHHYHPTAWVAAFAPAAGGAVITQSHKKGFAVGDIIPLPKSE